MDSIAESLIAAQNKAEALFASVVSEGLICPGKLESELSADIHALARERFGLRRHWHKRIVRAGANTLLTYHEEAADLRIAEDDLVYLDFGPVFEAWEADFGRTYALGADPDKHRLVGDLWRSHSVVARSTSSAMPTSRPVNCTISWPRSPPRPAGSLGRRQRVISSANFPTSGHPGFAALLHPAGQCTAAAGRRCVRTAAPLDFGNPFRRSAPTHGRILRGTVKPLTHRPGGLGGARRRA